VELVSTILISAASLAVAAWWGWALGTRSGAKQRRELIRTVRSLTNMIITTRDSSGKRVPIMPPDDDKEIDAPCGPINITTRARRMRREQSQATRDVQESRNFIQRLLGDRLN